MIHTGAIERVYQAIEQGADTLEAIEVKSGETDIHTALRRLHDNGRIVKVAKKPTRYGIPKRGCLLAEVWN